MLVTGCTLYEGTKDLFYEIEMFLHAELREAIRISRTEIRTARVTFRVCSVEGIPLSQEQCHQRFVMRSGVSYYPYLRF